VGRVLLRPHHRLEPLVERTGQLVDDGFENSCDSSVISERPRSRGRHALTAYGLRIDSAIELPGLRRATAEHEDADRVDIAFGEIANLQDVGPGDWHRLGPRCSTLVKAGVGAIEIRDGRRITVRVAGNAERELAHYILGPGMGLLLQQRGLFCLHASCVRIAGEAVAIAGDTGAGKSTLAHALLEAGHALVTDDIAAIDDSGTRPLVLPGHGALRMTFQHMTKAGLDPQGHEPLHAATDKRLVPLDPARCVREPLPLSRIYILARGDEQQTEEIDGLAGALAMLRHTFYPALQSGVVGTEALLQRCLRIREQVRVLRLQRNDDLTALPQLLRLIG